MKMRRHRAKRTDVPTDEVVESGCEVVHADLAKSPELPPPPRPRFRRVRTQRATQTPQAPSSSSRAPTAGSNATYTELDPELPELKYGDGYRGDQGIQWAGHGSEVVCAVLCRCGRWWGWYPERAAPGLRTTMQQSGCRRCSDD